MKRTKKISKRRVTPKGRFCVINSSAVATHGGPLIHRTILESEGKAIEHAKELLADNRTRGKHGVIFYIVQIIKVVSAGTPPVHVKSPSGIELSQFEEV